MASHSSQIYRAAQKTVRPSPSSTPWTPPNNTVSLSQGFIKSVNTFNGHADYQFIDPSGNGTIAQAVPYMQPYSALTPPTVNDLAWAMHVGPMMFLLAAQTNPTNFITL